MFWDGLSFGMGLGVAGIIIYSLFLILPGEKAPQGQNKIC